MYSFLKEELHVNSSFGQNVSRDSLLKVCESFWYIFSHSGLKGPLKRGKKSFRLSKCDNKEQILAASQTT